MTPSSGGSAADTPDRGRCDPCHPALLRGLTMPRTSTRRGAHRRPVAGRSGIGRREFLGLAGLSLSGALAGGGALLAACSKEHPAPPPLPPEPSPLPARGIAEYWAGRTPAGHFDFANWPLYIDTSPGQPNSHPTLDVFTSTTGITVSYREAIENDESFYAGIRPLLEASRPTGYDLMVIPNGQVLADLIRRNHLAPLDAGRLPAFFANADESVVNPSYDPNNRFTVAWQSGITGIAYDPNRTGREINSFRDLFDPAFAGRVGMFGDARDLPNFTLVGMGITPETSTPADWQKAAELLRRQRDARIVRDYYQQDYIEPLKKGDIWLSMAWSGDIFQANSEGADLRFVIPAEGGILWTDSMCIPVTAPHPVDAITFMNFVYQTDIAAKLAEGINYITPVPFARDKIIRDAGAASGPAQAQMVATADSPLVFPVRSDLSRLRRYRVLTQLEAVEWNSLFQSVYQP
ncbi:MULTISPECIES: spermidine/putrescine ABC transporter substrate-binding protein [Protofrankia]|uniref:ABC transporter substrate-binding protein n=1 Tax=Protofrankia coriariae TaxID=1562887 RepID=A0ABR5F4T4_9ACTN|nr:MULTISPECIES: spermidine/putrescine ABC transporter substrate-binding protein [Protofrankia]KLL11751.1 ABC transporter substrate-binding protein [Protofrankia coriariae]ONH38359.1 ABC transporter substrate-binding protein [Protofrankia sp. BMG5.30]